MSQTTQSRTRLNEPRALQPRNRWYFAQGMGVLIFGILSAANLLYAPFASILYIGIAMIAAAAISLNQAFSVTGWWKQLPRILASAIYAIAGLMVIHDPLFANFTLPFGLVLCLLGCFRIVFGLQERPHRAWPPLVVAGFATILIAMVVIAKIPQITPWHLGVLLTLDLILQGAALINFSLVAANFNKAG